MTRSTGAPPLNFIPRIDDDPKHVSPFDPLYATADSLQKALTAGTLTSTQIVEEYHRSILKYNGYLNAVYELAPDAMTRAQELDRLRSEGHVVGPMHGIPIILKDSMDTVPSMGMHTTAGAVAMLESESKCNAKVVDKLLEAGMIILGKATMSELGFFKGSGIRCAWSAVHGHAQSAYVRGGLDMSDSIAGHSSPAGSSSGSAIATSAGLCPLALGTETFGSLVIPANRAALYTVKPTRGIVPGDGILPISIEYDIAGPLAKCPKDVAEILTVLVDPSKTTVPSGGYASALDGADWKDIKVGTLDPSIWTFPPSLLTPVPEATEQVVRETNVAYAKIKSMAKSFHENLTEKTDDELMLNGTSAVQAKLEFGFEDSLNHYLSNLQLSKVRTLSELVKWNSDHSEEALTAEYPNQDLLVSCLENDHDPSKLQKIHAHLDKIGGEFMKLFDDYDVDVILSPGDAGVFNFSAACGFPAAALPLSVLRFNGRPFGLTVAARPHHEAMLIKTMAAFEKTFPPRQVPEAFLDKSKAQS